MKAKRTRRTVRVSRTGTRLKRSMTALAVFGIVSCSIAACSATSKISVKQNQGEQQQEVDIQHEGKLNNLSLIFNTTPVYGCFEK